MEKELVFDTLAYARKLRRAGVPEQQANVHAESLAGILDERIATKHDLKVLEERLSLKLTIRMGSMLTATTAVLATLIKIL